MVAIVGPTATGKTSLAIHLAETFDGEIISADSMQIYKGLDIGTAKATIQEQQKIPHHLLDIALPSERFSVAEFVCCAKETIQQIADQNKLPILVGGTGLYIESLLKGIMFCQQEFDLELRKRLEQQAAQQGAEYMYQWLMKIDPEYASTLHPNNQIRVLRAIELYQQSGLTMTQQRERSLPKSQPYQHLLLGLNCADRQLLYDRINQRVEQMVADGVEQEARYVYQHKESFVTAAQAIGYKEFFPFFEGEQTLEQAVEQLKQSTRRYAKRQLTWFRRMEEIQWLMVEENVKEKAVQLVQNHLQNP